MTGRRGWLHELPGSRPALLGLRLRSPARARRAIPDIRGDGPAGPSAGKRALRAPCRADRRRP
eukprot:15665081-Heterocapsa_arctica.AAC.1